MMRKKRFKHWLEKTIIRSWYDKKPIMVLLPFACFFSLIVRLRRFLYQKKVLTRYKAPVPVIVVGNITVGGTGKTPCVIAIAHYLKVHGFNPGIISRGYRGCYTEKAVILNKSSLPEQVGDEPVLLKRRCDCPVVVSRSRQQAIELLLAEEPQCRVIISDDGLQHYRLARDIEYVVIDASRGVGNGSLLPAGPLREPVSRLKACDTVIMNQSNQQASCDSFKVDIKHQTKMTLSLEKAYSLHAPTHQRALTEFQGKTVHAIAGIGNPARFFHQLSDLGLTIIEHAFSDHHAFSSADFVAFQNDTLLLTEKDAVKCVSLSLPNAWVVPAKAILEPDFYARLLARLMELSTAPRKYDH